MAVKESDYVRIIFNALMVLAFFAVMIAAGTWYNDLNKLRLSLTIGAIASFIWMACIRTLLTNGLYCRFIWTGFWPLLVVMLIGLFF